MHLYMEAPGGGAALAVAAKHRPKARAQEPGNGRGLPSEGGGGGPPSMRASVGATPVISTAASTCPGRTQAGPQNSSGTWLSYSCGEPWVVIEDEVNIQFGLSVNCTSPATSGCHDLRDASKKGEPARLPESSSARV